ncbi:hypothetical protein [Rhodococcus opacus]|uniref:hypothetical protein n=1 Tax=Rhodococcus opacus TaxID=37919 RepID=UPI0024BB4544|nr:hypothetical protein [Rhodococcus opacus]MDJ0413819.1 hypothetical protein [Rhodococcus opacus]
MTDPHDNFTARHHETQSAIRASINQLLSLDVDHNGRWTRVEPANETPAEYADPEPVTEPEVREMRPNRAQGQSGMAGSLVPKTKTSTEKAADLLDISAQMNGRR